MKALFGIASMLIIASSAQAQVWKCKNDATGKIEYSGTPCTTTSTGKTINAAPNEIDASGSRDQVQRTRARQAMEEAIEIQQNRAAMARDAAEDRARQASLQNKACADAEQEYQEAKRKHAPPSVMQPLKNKVRAACARDPSGVSPAAPPSMPTAGPTPSIITSCDATGCWDNLGGRYNKGAGSTYTPASGGRSCQLISGQMLCP